MNGPSLYEIRVQGHVTERWSDWFEGLAIHTDAGGQTTLRGPLPDQAALFGVLRKIHALNLTLLFLHKLPPEG